jgi:hypothetical protein
VGFEKDVNISVDVGCFSTSLFAKKEENSFFLNKKGRGKRGIGKARERKNGERKLAGGREVT